MRDEQLHAAVARSTFGSQNAQGTPFSEHFRKLRCRTSARRCGSKRSSTANCTTHTKVGSLLEVHAVVARSTIRPQNAQSTPKSDHFWKLRCGTDARCCGAKHMSKSKRLRFATLRHTTLHYTRLAKLQLDYSYSYTTSYYAYQITGH